MNNSDINPEVFRLIRKSEGLSIEGVIEKTGYRYSRIWQIERGPKKGGVRAGMSVIIRYSHAFKVPVWEILYLSHCIDTNEFKPMVMSDTCKRFLSELEVNKS